MATGIKQPSVYAHFRSRQALLEAAIEAVTRELYEFTRAAQAELRVAGASEPSALESHFETIVDNARRYRKVIVVWLAHRCERSELGQALRDVDERFVASIRDHVMALPSAPKPTGAERFARAMLESVAGSLRLHLDGHLPAKDTVNLLVNQVFAASGLLS